ncbi:MAG: flagellar protein export ATPase FliI [bacterium]
MGEISSDVRVPVGDDLRKYHKALKSIDPIKLIGRVIQVIGLVIEATGPKSRVGEICKIYIDERRGDVILAEIVGFREGKVLLMPLGDMNGIGPGCLVVSTGSPLRVNVGDDLLGRILDGLGNPIDGKGPVKAEAKYPVTHEPPDPLFRRRITEPLSLGIKAVDSALTCGKGQRLGIFSGSGIGKSTLMGMIARFTEADVNVVGLIGERGREVREFLEKDLGEEGLKRSVVVVATSDKAPLIRLRGAYVATTIAEYFRDKGKDVLLMMDSVTRFARAQREVGLAIGEPPATRAFTPSVFEVIPKLVERTGTSDRGSITGIYTVLIEADDMNEPVADTMRSVLDGHIFLSRDLAHVNHYPAIDVLGSVSRVMIDIVDPEHNEAARRLRDVLATYRQAEDLINIGAYVDGSNAKIDYAKSMIDRVNAFLKQGITEYVSYEDAVRELKALFE